MSQPAPRRPVSATRERPTHWAKDARRPHSAKVWSERSRVSVLCDRRCRTVPKLRWGVCACADQVPLAHGSWATMVRRCSLPMDISNPACELSSHMYVKLLELVRRDNDETFEAALDAYRALLGANNAEACRFLSGMCTYNHRTLHAYWRVYQAQLEAGQRLNAGGGDTSLRALLFKVTDVKRSASLMSLPATARRQLRRALEDRSSFVGDFHLATLGMFMPTAEVGTPPDHQVHVAAASTDGADYCELPPAVECAEAMLVVFVTLHVGSADKGTYSFEEADNALEGFQWDLSGLCGATASFVSAAPGAHALGEILAGRSARKVWDDIGQQFDDESPEEPWLVLKSWSLNKHAEEPEPAVYRIGAEFRDGDQVLRSYLLARTTAPAMVLSYLFDVFADKGALRVELEDEMLIGF